jgi:hypothetical protein
VEDGRSTKGMEDGRSMDGEMERKEGMKEGREEGR